MHRSRPDDLIVGPAILFAPANRPDIFPKAAAIADMVILDLEDGAGDAERDVARNNIAQASLDPSRVIVRVCGPDDPGFKEDVEMVRSTPYSLVMVPKVYTDIPKELEGLHVIAMIETPQAVVGIQGIAEHPDVVGLFWGAEDLTVLLGGTHSRFMPDEGAPDNRPGPYRDTMRAARQRTCSCAGLAARPQASPRPSRNGPIPGSTRGSSSCLASYFLVSSFSAMR